MSPQSPLPRTPAQPRTPKPPAPPSPQEERVLAQQRRKVLRDRGMVYVGFGLLLSGYALLAVSPDTPAEWLLPRVGGGFALLFIGFALAIVPWLSRITRGEE